MASLGIICTAQKGTVMIALLSQRFIRNQMLAGTSVCSPLQNANGLRGRHHRTKRSHGCDCSCNLDCFGLALDRPLNLTYPWLVVVTSHGNTQACHHGCNLTAFERKCMVSLPYRRLTWAFQRFWILLSVVASHLLSLAEPDSKPLW